MKPVMLVYHTTSILHEYSKTQSFLSTQWSSNCQYLSHHSAKLFLHLKNTLGKSICLLLDQAVVYYGNTYFTQWLWAIVMTECWSVLVPVIFNPPLEAKISSSFSHRPELSRAEHLAMQALINTGMVILSGTRRGEGGGRGQMFMSAGKEMK